MTYDEAIEWLLSFADFERSGRFQDRPDVAPMLALLECLGNPHLGHEFVPRATVHVAGSKGKGSVAAMVEAMAVHLDVHAGLYSSPHLYSYTERIRMHGKPIAEARFAQLTGRLQEVVGDFTAQLNGRSLVTFDLLTALGLLAFHEDPNTIDLQILEVGLGGRVDSTNVFDTKEVAVVTPISLEHTSVLGDNVEQIAREKAAIITPGCAVVMAPQSYPDAGAVIRSVAEKAEALLIDVSTDYHWRNLSHDARGQQIYIETPTCTAEVKLPLLGKHQVENAATAVAAFDGLRQRSHLEFLNLYSNQELADGLASVRWPCRIEILREDPLVIADGAHNRDSARRLAETLVEYFACDRAVFVIGCGSDKDIDGLAEELAPLASRVLAVRSEHPRAMDPQRIVEVFGRLNVDSEIVDKVPDAVDRAIADAGARALICVAGSLFVAAEARAHVLGLGT